MAGDKARRYDHRPVLRYIVPGAATAEKVAEALFGAMLPPPASWAVACDEEKDEWRAAARRAMESMTTAQGCTDFSDAIRLLKAGRRVCRSGWNGKGMWLLLQRPDENSKMTHPYVYIEYPVGHPAYPNGSRIPWLASQTDLLAEDWQVVP